MKWSATMPRTPPAAGQAHVVLAYKTDDMIRMEFDGELSKKQAEQLFSLAIQMSQKGLPK